MCSKLLSTCQIRVFEQSQVHFNNEIDGYMIYFQIILQRYVLFYNSFFVYFHYFLKIFFYFFYKVNVKWFQINMTHKTSG